MDRLGRTKDGRRVKIYNCMIDSENYIAVDKDLVIASGFKHLNPMIVNAHDANAGSVYTQSKYLDDNEIVYTFTNNKTKEIDGVYYQLFKNNNGTYYCKKYVKNSEGKYETDEENINIIKWYFPGDLNKYCEHRLPNGAFNPNIQDCGFMTISEAQLIKDKGTTI
jgi:hypothetical protein